MLLLQHGAAVDATTKDLYTPLHIAAKEGQEEVSMYIRGPIQNFREFARNNMNTYFKS